MFCPKCGSILLPKSEGAKRILSCRCGYKSDASSSSVLKDAKKKDQATVEVVHDAESLQTLPKMSEECPKCHHKEAYYWLLQTRAGDEPETKFLKCVKCKHIWRDYK